MSIDQPQRLQALDPNGSFLVQAPAGSGKTELLTQRYLRLLSLVDQPEQIVAITFTRKAASEMRNRIMEKLDWAQKEPFESLEHEHERTTHTLASAALGRDLECGWQLFQHPSRLRVMTIDALCASLSRQMPYLSALGSQGNTTDNAEPLYQLAAERTLLDVEEADNEIGHACRTLLAHLDNNLLLTQQLLARMLASRSHWGNLLTHMRGDPSMLRQDLENALAATINDEYELLTKGLSVPMQQSLMPIAQHAAQNLLESGSDSRITRLIDWNSVLTASDRHLWQALADFLLTNDGKLRSRLDKNMGLPPESKSQKETLLDVLELLRPQEMFIDQLNNCRNLPEPYYHEGQWAILQALFTLLPVAAAQLLLVFRDKGQLDFTQVALAARDALGEEENPTDLALQLDYQIRHLLVDEFQDTSMMQYELLQRLTRGWQAGDGRTLFLVGDPMQSIYRFREAEVGVFLLARENGIGHVPLHFLQLQANFRSQAGVVQWVNQTFRAAFPAQESTALGAIPYSPSVASNAALEGEAVQVHASLGEDEAFTVERTLAICREALEQSHSIAILVRSRAHAQPIAVALREAGMNYQAVDMESLADMQVIRDLTALTRALRHLADRPAWLALLHTPFCGLNLKDLHVLCGSSAQNTVLSQISDRKRHHNLSRPGRERLPYLLTLFERSLGDAGRRTLRQRVEELWHALGGAAALQKRDELEYAERFFQLLGQLENEQRLDELETELGMLLASSQNQEHCQISIMTMHKSKGLEFDTVILPGLGKTGRSDDKPLLVWQEYPRSDRHDILLAPLHAREEKDDPLYNHIRRIHGEKDELEKTRLLYVACTRAKKRLHLIGHTSFNQQKEEPARPPRSTLLDKIWDSVAIHFHPSHAHMAAPKIEIPWNELPARPYFRLPSHWQHPQLDTLLPPHVGATASLNSDLPDSGITNTGTLVHLALERLSHTPLIDDHDKLLTTIEPWLRLEAEALGAENPQQHVQTTLWHLTQILQDELGRLILEPHEGAHSEWQLHELENGQRTSHIIDRSFISRAGDRWVVDYKTSQPAANQPIEAFLKQQHHLHGPQLMRYARLLSILEPHHPIRLMLYFTALGQGYEWRSDGLYPVWPSELLPST